MSLDIQKKRIEWVDLAKGICICLVVYGHVILLYGVDSDVDIIVRTFRMPLYFILSGIFFKRYDGLLGFMKRKINKLLIPYVFYFLITGYCVPMLLHYVCGLKIMMYEPSGWTDIFHIFTELPNGNQSIWFLLCLFEINILFYFVTLLVDMVLKSKFKAFGYGIISLVLGGIGLMCSYYSLNIPSFMDTALSATPFFYFGWLVKNQTHFLYSKSTFSNFFPSLLFVVVSLIAMIIFCGTRCGFYYNDFDGVKGIALLYPLGVLGAMSVFFLSRFFVKLPLLSYWGRYSIMILVTHIYVIQIIAFIFRCIGWESPFLYLITTGLSLLCYLLIIPVMKVVVPYVTAQKDIIKV